MLDNRYKGLALSNAAGTARWKEGDPFSSVQPGFYWSSSNGHEDDGSEAYYVRLYYGYVGTNGKTDTNYVWPVRRRQ
jgi:hypothetical protein